MESKRFEIKMSKTVWCAKNIENCLQIHHKGTVKVAEIKPPTPMSVEYCKCNIPLSNQEKQSMVCNCCSKPIKPKPPIVEPEAPIEELDLRSKEFEVYMVGEKVNEIIDWIENHSKEA